MARKKIRVHFWALTLRLLLCGVLCGFELQFRRLKVHRDELPAVVAGGTSGCDGNRVDSGNNHVASELLQLRGLLDGLFDGGVVGLVAHNLNSLVSRVSYRGEYFTRRQKPNPCGIRQSDSYD